MGTLDELIKARVASLPTSKGLFRKFQSGINNVRFFPFNHTVTASDVLEKRYSGASAGEVVQELAVFDPTHFLPGHTVKKCTGAGCVTCQRVIELLGGSETDRRLGKTMSVRLNHLMWGVVTDELPAGKASIFTLPVSLYKAILGFLVNEEFGGATILGAEGRDFIITHNRRESPANMYSVVLRDKERCSKIPSEVFRNIEDIFGLRDRLRTRQVPSQAAMAVGTPQPVSSTTQGSLPIHVDTAAGKKAAILLGDDTTGGAERVVGTILRTIPQGTGLPVKYVVEVENIQYECEESEVNFSV